MTEVHDGDFDLGGLESHFGALQNACGGNFGALNVVRQVHENKVVTVESGEAGLRSHGEADGLVTGSPGQALGIRVADCVPVFLAESSGRCVGAVHAGRAGTVSNIAAQAVRTMGERYGVRPDEIRALVGPSAGPCCYEVDTDTAKLCFDRGLVVLGRRVNLWESNRLQLVNAGVPREGIEVSEICTICSAAFHSYRRTGTAAHNLALITM